MLCWHLPFTAQKLVNRIKALMPGDGNNVVNVGPIRLDLENRRVRSLGKNTRLTPTLDHAAADPDGQAR